MGLRSVKVQLQVAPRLSLVADRTAPEGKQRPFVHGYVLTAHVIFHTADIFL